MLSWLVVGAATALFDAAVPGYVALVSCIIPIVKTLLL